MREGWEYKKLGEVVQILNGYAFKSSLYEEQGIRIMRITNVQKGEIVDDDPKYYPLSKSEEIKNYLLKEKDLLMSLTGNVGRVGLLNKGMLPAALNQRVACLRVKDGNLQLEFIFHLLNSGKFEQDAILSSKGIAQKNMSTEWLKEYIIPLPPLPVQQSIVAELDEINNLLSLKRKQLETYDKLAQSLFYEMFGDPVENERGWEVKKLGDVCASKKSIQRASKKYLVDEEIKYIDISSIDNKSQSLNGYTKYLMKEAPSRAQQCVNCGDILVSTVRPNLKNIAVVNSYEKCLVASSGFCVLRPTHIKMKYLFYLIIGDRYTQYLVSLTTGANYPAVRDSDIFDSNIPLPPLPLQQLFASRIEAIEAQKANVKTAIEKLETLLAARMQYWFD